MLILTRKPDQGIVIDGDTTVRVLAVDGDRVKLGIEAPPRVIVLREELLREVAGENRRAARSAGSRTVLDGLRSLKRATAPPLQRTRRRRDSAQRPGSDA